MKVPVYSLAVGGKLNCLVKLNVSLNPKRAPRRGSIKGSWDW